MSITSETFVIRKIFYIYLVLHSTINITHTAHLDWFKITSFHFLNDLKAHQLRLFINSSRADKLHYYSAFAQSLTKQFPSVKIDLSTIQFLSNGTLTLTENFVNNGPVIYVHGGNWTELNDQIMNFFEFYDKVYSEVPMPKCLIIFLNHLNASNDKTIKKLLEYAWTKKFIDISVLEVSVSSNRAHVRTFNPFFDKLSKKNLSYHSRFFPNKLFNPNKYPLKIITHINPPYQTVTKDVYGNKVYDGYKVEFLKMVLKEMKYLIVVHQVELNQSRNLIDYRNYICDHLRLQRFNMYIAPIFALEAFIPLPLLILNDDCIPYVGIILETSPTIHFHLSREFIFFFICIPVIFCFIKFLIFLFQSKTFNFDVLDVFRLILGISLDSFPKNFFKRIIILLIFCVSAIFSIDFIVSILSTLVSYEEFTFKSMKEIIESDYKLAMNNVVKKIVLDSVGNGTSSALKQKIIGENIVCPHPAMKNEKIICVLSMIRAKNVIEKSLHNGSEVYKMIEVKFGCNVAAYPFERASPFINHFRSIFTKMYESGIYYWISKKTEKNNDHGDMNRKEISDDLFLKSLPFFMTFAFAISVIVFLIEVTIHKLLLTRNQN